MTKEEAKQKIAELAAKYQNLTSKKYNEEATKQGFILPLFNALGWNTEDSMDEVVPEEKASNGRVDYAFKLNGVSQFYLEAKSLKQDIDDPDYIKQITDYAYYKGVTWAVLTNFSELRILNAQEHKPFINLNCESYISDFEDLWLLSREAFEQGLLIQKATKYGALAQPIPIEHLLYRDLRQWRGELFGQLRGHNKDLSRSQIDEIIQKFFNRLIFIRTCEDRGIENKQVLEAVRQWEKAGYKGELIDTVKSIFQQYDTWYDSDLFSKHLVDTDKVFVEGQTVESILRGMAKYPFDLIDADVLGAVYEQYLGFVAVENKESAGQLKLGIVDDTTYKVVDKKKYRKEQGIYYTPKFITDYIVKETVGRFLKERGYNEVRNMKILDPACGSGSFLIRAYDELLKYHAWQKSKQVHDLDQWERLPILTGNIFGVDLDMQAVEVARLNLLLRSLGKRAILEPLANNIKTGNSLISGAEEELKGYFGDSWKQKRPFDWEEETPGIFDVVIGNPPYVRIQSLPREEADYYREYYRSAHGSFDIYVLFIEKAISLLKTGGRLGFITSGKFLKADYGKKLQQLIRDDCVVENIVDLSAQQVFGEATTYPSIIILRKGTEDAALRYTFVPDKVDLAKEPMANIPATTTEQDAVIKGIWPPISTGDNFLRRISKNTVPLGELASRIFQGLVTSADKIYILEKWGESVEGKIKVFSRSLDKVIELDDALLKPLLLGKHIERFGTPTTKQMLLFPYKVKGDTAELIAVDEFSSQYPKCWHYLLQNREALENRENGKMKHEKWYGYVYPKSLTMFDKPKILTGVLANKSRFAIDKDGTFYFMGGGNAGGYGVTLNDNTMGNYLYILGLLNSKLLDFSLKKISSPFRGGYFSYARRYIEKLPIRTIDFSNLSDKKRYDDLVAAVEKMLELKKKISLHQDVWDSQREGLLKEIEQIDNKIDNLVYELYGLTEEERKIVEDSVK